MVFHQHEFLRAIPLKLFFINLVYYSSIYPRLRHCRMLSADKLCFQHTNVHVVSQEIIANQNTMVNMKTL